LRTTSRSFTRTRSTRLRPLNSERDLQRRLNASRSIQQAVGDERRAGAGQQRAQLVAFVLPIPSGLRYGFVMNVFDEPFRINCWDASIATMTSSDHAEVDETVCTSSLVVEGLEQLDDFAGVIQLQVDRGLRMRVTIWRSR